MSQVKERTPISKLVSSRSSPKAFENGAEQGPRPGVHHHASGRATGHAAAEIAGVCQFPGALALSFIGLGGFLHRHGFTGQRRLAQEEVLGDQQPHVGRDDGTGLQQNDITRNNVR